MESKHSLNGKISFVTLLIGIIFLILRIVDLALEDYLIYDQFAIFGILSKLINILLLISLITSFVTGIISVFQKEYKKTFPTISLSIILFLLLLVTLFFVQEISTVYKIERGVVTNYGIFEIPSDKNNNKVLYEQRYLMNNTDEIPALKGIRFGFHYVLVGEPDDHSIEIMKVTKYPQPGLKRNDRIIFSDTTYFSVSLNKLRYSGFQFDYDSELIPGKWEFEMWYKGNKLLSKSFKIFLQL